MKGTMISLQHKDEPSFLTANEIPANKRFKVGDEVQLRVLRSIIRSGYRYSPADFREQSCALLREHGTKWLQEIQSHMPSPQPKVMFGAPQKVSNRVYAKFADVLAGILCENARFGGPERGIHIEWLPSHRSMFTYKVLGFKRFQVGRRYPASYGTNNDGYCDDYEPGGLADRKTVVAVDTDHGLFFSGDCEKVC